jgi:hypothetical protein
MDVMKCKMCGLDHIGNCDYSTFDPIMGPRFGKKVVVKIPEPEIEEPLNFALNPKKKGRPFAKRS